MLNCGCPSPTRVSKGTWMVYNVSRADILVHSFNCRIDNPLETSNQWFICLALESDGRSEIRNLGQNVVW